MFDVRRLQCLLAVHVHGTVLDAAFELGLTPSAVSQQIGKLEREVGTRLLERAGRGVVLTDAALVLVEAAQEISTISDRATARLEDLREGLSGTLRIACFPSAVGPHVAPALTALRADAPGAHLQLHEMFPDRASDAVIGGHVDVAVIHLWGDALPTVPRGFTSRFLADDPVEILVPASHRLADRGEVAFEDLVDDIWVTDDLEGFYRTWLIRRMSEIGRRPRIDYLVDEIAAQIALIAGGLCIGVLPRLAYGELPPTVRNLSPAGASPFRRLHLVYRHESFSRPIVRRFVEALGAVPGDVHIVD